MSPELHALCTLLSSTAEAEILPRFRQTASRAKADGSLVTEADLAAQRVITAELARSYPGVPLLGEEMSAAEQERLLAGAPEGVWCLDPLDGTTNYASGFPYFGVSLALLRGGEVRLGVIHDPVRGECFAAEQGVGAWLNGDPLRLAENRGGLGECLAMVDLKRLTAAEAGRMGPGAPFRSQRNLGSVALDWCWLAAGRGQLYLHGGQKLWDYAAGRLIADEAGAVSRLYERGSGAPAVGLSLAPRRAVAAANPVLLEAWEGWLRAGTAAG
jgi:myo-inositol-1(or 4)-monophosphatase